MNVYDEELNRIIKQTLSIIEQSLQINQEMISKLDIFAIELKKKLRGNKKGLYEE